MAVEQQPSLPAASQQETIGEKPTLTALDIVQILDGYRREAKLARESGPHGRDIVWNSNVDLYWNNFDYSKKAAWQSKEAMPEAPMFVDRWAAAMREALLAAGEWFTVTDPADKENDLSPHIVKFLKVLLRRVGRNQAGQPIPFDAVFEEQMKLAAMMAAAASVKWKEDAEGKGYVAVEDVDPREIWYDPTGRGLYRVRRFTIDAFRLKEMKGLRDGNDEPIFNIDEIARFESALHEEVEIDKQRLAGHDVSTSVNRKPITIDEYLCTLLDREGNKIADNVLCVVANERYLIRGPEKNPFWHKRDWIVYAPAITVPLSVYGRSYMENWSSIARTFVELTNLLIDATYTTSMKAFAMVPDMLEDPTEAREGVFPNKAFQLESGSDPQQFLTAIDLGSIPTSSIEIWQALKNELREGAAFSEIALGQLAPGEKTATEVSSSQQSSASLLRSIARTIETRFLEPTLDLMWKTGLQHLSAGDREMRDALGEEVFAMFVARRREFASRKITFQARGLSALIDRQQQLQKVLNALQTFAANPILAQVFFGEKSDPRKLVDLVLRLMGVDTEQMQMTPRERQMAQIAQLGQQLTAMAQSTGSPEKSRPNPAENAQP